MQCTSSVRRAGASVAVAMVVALAAGGGVRAAAIDGAADAGWKTAAVRARGDILFAAGMCRRMLTAIEVIQATEGYVGGVTPRDPDQARLSDYYEQRYAEGQQAVAAAPIDKRECMRRLGERRDALAKIGSTRPPQ